MFQHTAARRRLAKSDKERDFYRRVSTHSRPKAAGSWASRLPPPARGFNTQPPEGGWRIERGRVCPTGRFNTQPPEGGWMPCACSCAAICAFQHTAARRRLGVQVDVFPERPGVSTHSRPKAAGDPQSETNRLNEFQHTAARRRLVCWVQMALKRKKFQHTAARRRLVLLCRMQLRRRLFQHTAARRRLESLATHAAGLRMFQHTAARRRLGGRYWVSRKYS